MTEQAKSDAATQVDMLVEPETATSTKSDHIANPTTPADPDSTLVGEVQEKLQDAGNLAKFTADAVGEVIRKNPVSAAAVIGGSVAAIAGSVIGLRRLLKGAKDKSA